MGVRWQPWRRRPWAWSGHTAQPPQPRRRRARELVCTELVKCIELLLATISDLQAQITIAEETVVVEPQAAEQERLAEQCKEMIDNLRAKIIDEDEEPQKAYGELSAWCESNGTKIGIEPKTFMK